MSRTQIRHSTSVQPFSRLLSKDIQKDLLQNQYGAKEGKNQDLELLVAQGSRRDSVYMKNSEILKRKK